MVKFSACDSMLGLYRPRASHHASQADSTSSGWYASAIGAEKSFIEPTGVVLTNFALDSPPNLFKPYENNKATREPHRERTRRRR